MHHLLPHHLLAHLGEEMEGGLRQAGAHPVEPEVAPRLAQDCLVQTQNIT